MEMLDNLHSRVVFWLKIVLPLTALAILSTLFLFSRRIDTDAALPYAEVDVEELARDRRLTAPEFSGMTEDGAEVTILAQVARPGSDGIDASGLSATYATPAGLQIEIAATKGMIDAPGNLLALDGDVRIVTSSGYVVETTGLRSALDRTQIETSGQIKAETPFGRIDAGRMELHDEGDGTVNYVMLFSGGVKLIYLPPTREPQ